MLLDYTKRNYCAWLYHNIYILLILSYLNWIHLNYLFYYLFQFGKSDTFFDRENQTPQGKKITVSGCLFGCIGFSGNQIAVIELQCSLVDSMEMKSTCSHTVVMQRPFFSFFDVKWGPRV